jgi:ribose transport system substrate-binding protein
VAIDGIPGTYCNDQRVAGLNRALAEYPDIELLGSIQPGGYNRFDATPVMEDFIAAYGDEIGGVWTANDDMAIGVIEALAAAGMEDVEVAGVDTIGEAVEAIIAGDMTVTLGGDAQGMHGTGILYAYNAVVNGIWPEDKEIFWEPPIVTAENAEEILDMWFTNYAGHDWQTMCELLGGE